MFLEDFFACFFDFPKFVVQVLVHFRVIATLFNFANAFSPKLPCQVSSLMASSSVWFFLAIVQFFFQILPHVPKRMAHMNMMPNLRFVFKLHAQFRSFTAESTFFQLLFPLITWFSDGFVLIIRSFSPNIAKNEFDADFSQISLFLSFPSKSFP